MSWGWRGWSEHSGGRASRLGCDFGGWPCQVHAPVRAHDAARLRRSSGSRGSVVWLAQMVAVMPSIERDQSRIKTGRMWLWCRMTRAAAGGRAGTTGCCVRAAAGSACSSWPAGPGWIRIGGSAGMWCAAGWAAASCRISSSARSGRWCRRAGSRAGRAAARSRR